MLIWQWSLMARLKHRDARETHHTVSAGILDALGRGFLIASAGVLAGVMFGTAHLTGIRTAHRSPPTCARWASGAAEIDMPGYGFASYSTFSGPAPAQEGRREGGVNRRLERLMTSTRTSS
jgi:hypothetical protein